MKSYTHFRRFWRLLDLSLVCVACCGNGLVPDPPPLDPNRNDKPARPQAKLIAMHPYEEAFCRQVSEQTPDSCETRCKEAWHIQHPGSDDVFPTFKTSSNNGTGLYQFMGHWCRFEPAAYVVFNLGNDGSSCSGEPCVLVSEWNVFSYSLEFNEHLLSPSAPIGTPTTGGQIRRDHAGLSIQTTPENRVGSHGEATIVWSLRPRALTEQDERDLRKGQHVGNAPMTFFYPEYVSRQDRASISAAAMATSFEKWVMHGKPWSLSCAPDLCQSAACRDRQALCPLVIHQAHFTSEQKRAPGGGVTPFSINSLVGWRHPDEGDGWIRRLDEARAISGLRPSGVVEDVGGIITAAGAYDIPAYVILSYLVAEDVVLTAVVEVKQNDPPKVISTMLDASPTSVMLPDTVSMSVICETALSP